MITISKLISRSDKEALASKVPDVNIVLKQFCKQRAQGFIDHSNISAIDYGWSFVAEFNNVYLYATIYNDSTSTQHIFIQRLYSFNINNGYFHSTTIR